MYCISHGPSSPATATHKVPTPDGRPHGPRGHTCDPSCLPPTTPRHGPSNRSGLPKRRPTDSSINSSAAWLPQTENWKTLRRTASCEPEKGPLYDRLHASTGGDPIPLSRGVSGSGLDLTSKGPHHTGRAPTTVGVPVPTRPTPETAVHGPVPTRPTREGGPRPQRDQVCGSGSESGGPDLDTSDA